MKKDREYLYVVDVRKVTPIKVQRGGETITVNEVTWERREQVATSMVEVSRLLKIKLDDLRYLTKGML